MDIDKTKICNIISEMLDNPDENEIYPTTKAYNDLERYVEKVRVETIGWTHADACTHMDKNIDYRKVNVPSILDRALEDLS